MSLGILLLRGYTISDAYEEICEKIMQYIDSKDVYSEWLKEFTIIFNLHECNEDNIKSSGYVVDSLIAAIAGGLAGIYYGYESIPASWIRRLRNKEFIMSICQKWNNK